MPAVSGRSFPWASGSIRFAIFPMHGDNIAPGLGFVSDTESGTSRFKSDRQPACRPFGTKHHYAGGLVSCRESGELIKALRSPAARLSLTPRLTFVGAHATLLQLTRVHGGSRVMSSGVMSIDEVVHGSVVSRLSEERETMREQSRTAARPSRLVLRTLCAAMLVVILWNEAHAQSVRIVALGASNTAGFGVGKAAAWPARLERLLKAKGIAAAVDNAGISGNSSRDLLARLDSAVPKDAQLVVLQANGFNDRRKGQQGEFAGNVAEIKARLTARKIRVLHLPADLYGLIRSHPQSDGIHLTLEGHAKLARGFFPKC